MNARTLVLATLCTVVGALALPAGASAEAGCPNESLRQGLSANLPDCRAYELVSPPYKQGAKLEVTAASPDGSRVLVRSFGNFGDVGNNQAVYGATYVLSRGSAGWTEANVDPPASQFPFDLYRDGTPDLSRTLFVLRGASQSARNFDFWVRDADGALHDLGPVLPPADTVGPPGLGEPEGPVTGVVYRGASSDLSRVLFNSEKGRWPGDTTEVGAHSLYEYVAGRGGPPLLVGVGNGGGLIGECGVDPGPQGGGRNGYPAPGAVSVDGSKVFFTVNGAAGAARNLCGLVQPPVDEVFARVNESSTVAISESSPNAQCTTPSCVGAPVGNAEYMAASADGSMVFFASTQQLMDGASEDSTPGDSATAEGGIGCQVTSGVSGCNLYGYDFQNPVGRRLVLVSGGDPNPQVQGVVRVSEDGSHVYFVAKGVLTPAANQFGAEAVAGAENLYVFERDASFPGGRTAFVGALSPGDSEAWEGPGEGLSATATPDGRFLVFESVADLTPDDTSTARQVFRYDAQGGELVRVSVGQGGFNQDGNTDTLPAQINLSGLSGSGLVARPPSAVSTDGRYVVFQSADGLTPGALNAHPTDRSGVLAQNVYEYHDGSVSLLSDGMDASSIGQESSVRLVGTVGLGGDVFFQTADPLVSQDGDTQRDVYDARVNGGFPPEQGVVGCQGDACQGALAPAPALAGAGSVGFSGPGNLSPAGAAPKKHVVKPKKPKPRRRKHRGKKAGRAGRSSLVGRSGRVGRSR
jgi:hypothetical protein